MSRENPDKVVTISAERWAALEASQEWRFNPPGEYVTLNAPRVVDGILFLPAVYRAA